MDTLIFRQIHIDVARNATDDFNPFHDKHKWSEIHQNPFNGPIVLGFQLESLIEHKIAEFRMSNGEMGIIQENELRYSNYQFSFANAVKAGHEVEVNIKRSQFSEGEHCSLSNRVSLKSEGKLDLIGYKKETQTPMFLPNIEMEQFYDLQNCEDRSFIHGGPFFLKRKFMTTSNAKNFLSGSLAEQSDYFDEILGKANFPEIFPCSLISCALLEKSILQKHDFIKNPMVYTGHKISIDRKILAKVKSNDVLHILAKQVEFDPSITMPISKDNTDRVYECYGIIGDDAILFRGLISLAYLKNILASVNKRKRDRSH